MILEKALTLELTHFEDSEFYDKLTRARREASSRPLSLVMRTSGLLQNADRHRELLGAAGGLLALGRGRAARSAACRRSSPRRSFSGDAFRLFRWRAPETRMQTYLETVLAREDHAKEVKLFDLGKLFLGRYKAIFEGLYEKDRNLTIRREPGASRSTLVSIAALYGAYAWVRGRARCAGVITLGEMTMYLMLFRQGQTAVTASLGAIGGMYEDNLYLSTLYEYLEQPVETASGTAVSGPDPDAGVQFENVEFRYPGSDTIAITGINLQIKRGERLALVGENGSGKTTLIKLLTRLYEPDCRAASCSTAATCTSGTPTRCAGASASSSRTSCATSSSSARTSAPATCAHFDDEPRWREAAEQGKARAVHRRACRSGYDTQLGKWFKDGRELSGGQWQKIALSRAFMRSDADILVLDEPTAAMDAAAEAEVFEHFRSLMGETHRHRDLAPLLHRAHGRPDRGARPGPHRRARQPRGADEGGRHLLQTVHAAGARLSIEGCRRGGTISSEHARGCREGLRLLTRLGSWDHRARCSPSKWGHS